MARTPRTKPKKPIRAAKSEVGRGPPFVQWTVGHAITLVLGAMLANMPFWSGAWVIVGLLPVLALAYKWTALAGKKRRLALSAAAVVAVFSWYHAWREWAGANLRLDYRVCGAPQVVNGKVASFFFGTEWINPHSHDIVVRAESSLLNVEDHNSKVPLDRGIMRIYASGEDGSHAKFSNFVDFENPLPLTGQLSGRVRYTFHFGKDNLHLNRPLVLDGTFTVLARDVRGKSFRFSPSSESSSGFVGGCEIEPQFYVRL